MGELTQYIYIYICSVYNSTEYSRELRIRSSTLLQLYKRLSNIVHPHLVGTFTRDGTKTSTVLVGIA